MTKVIAMVREAMSSFEERHSHPPTHCFVHPKDNDDVSPLWVSGCAVVLDVNCPRGAALPFDIVSGITTVSAV
jgi:hypothetical protein